MFFKTANLEYVFNILNYKLTFTPEKFRNATDHRLEY